MDQQTQFALAFEKALANYSQAGQKYREAEERGKFDRASMVIIRDSLAAMADLTHLAILKADESTRG